MFHVSRLSFHHIQVLCNVTQLLISAKWDFSILARLQMFCNKAIVCIIYCVYQRWDNTDSEIGLFTFPCLIESESNYNEWSRNLNWNRLCRNRPMTGIYNFQSQKLCLPKDGHRKGLPPIFRGGNLMCSRFYGIWKSAWLLEKLNDLLLKKKVIWEIKEISQEIN